jgi:pimeloyl-ACP methyl ester carboxylesterase
VAAVLAALDADGAGPVVLAGHSLGGVTISQVADQHPDRIARLIYCAAFVLDDGESAADVMPEQMRTAITELSTTRPDRAIPCPGNSGARTSSRPPASSWPAKATSA